MSRARRRSLDPADASSRRPRRGARGAKGAGLRLGARPHRVRDAAALHAALPGLAALEGERSVALVSSINAVAGFGLPAYSAAKAALLGLTTALAGRLGRLGIRVNVVAPGTVPTATATSLWQDPEAGYMAQLRYSALGRPGTPDDVADAVLALATTLTHVTGQMLVVGGGQTVHRPL